MAINAHLKLKVDAQELSSNLMANTTDQDLAAAFRQHLPDLASPRFTTSAKQSPYEYAEAFQASHVPPWLYNLTQAWKELLQEPYKGVSVDGIS